MSAIDRYDVEAMIRDALYSYASRRDLDELRTSRYTAEDELRAQLAELRERIDAAKADVLSDLDDLRDDIVTLGKQLEGTA